MSFQYFYSQAIEEATNRFVKEQQKKNRPFYYAGGTEILTLRRLSIIHPKAVIDIKNIPACNIYQLDDDYLALGAALPLTEIEEKNLFPLLTDVSKEIADHTARNKITFGGNICGQIFYREAILPLLLTDSLLVLAKDQMIRTELIHNVFDEQLLLDDGELFIQAFIEKKYLAAPYVAIKKRQQWTVGYPLLSIAALKIESTIRVAISGLCSFPFRSLALEAALNDPAKSNEEKIKGAIATITEPILDDVEGSSEYRLFVLENLLHEVLQQLEEE
ncbi:FAD binding domain-containing protein [Niallia sp. NCCP-28]|uniref:FAD binding domain-containing protein n=1 Tax=Niallia sp. NCCP-28 TaxID=2934712 RepID=UPI0020894D8C|nr:FAD binding domain-containing protein [Niallia sp. NCCP-28]GKU82738.1 xanthine dehydrogenase [Niallia sp. NCCP-28]